MVGRRHALVDRDEDHSDTLIVLQHPSVYTLGSGSSEKYLNFDIQNSPYDLYRTERGGEVTYHGPGQVFISLTISKTFLLSVHAYDPHCNCLHSCKHVYACMPVYFYLLYLSFENSNILVVDHHHYPF